MRYMHAPMKNWNSYLSLLMMLILSMKGYYITILFFLASSFSFDMPFMMLSMMHAVEQLSRSKSFFPIIWCWCWCWSWCWWKIIRTESCFMRDQKSKYSFCNFNDDDDDDTNNVGFYHDNLLFYSRVENLLPVRYLVSSESKFSCCMGMSDFHAPIEYIYILLVSLSFWS